MWRWPGNKMRSPNLKSVAAEKRGLGYYLTLFFIFRLLHFKKIYECLSILMVLD